MKLIIPVFLLIMFAAGCSDSDPVSTVPADGTITLSYSSTVGNEARLLFSNNTATPVRYLGFGASSPLKRVEFLSDTGWVTSLWEWCGTGATEYSVQARTSVMVSAPVFRSGFKHRVLFGVTVGEAGEYRTITSNEFQVP